MGTSKRAGFTLRLEKYSFTPHRPLRDFHGDPYSVGHVLSKQAPNYEVPSTRYVGQQYLFFRRDGARQLVGVTTVLVYVVLAQNHTEPPSVKRVSSLFENLFRLISLFHLF